MALSPRVGRFKIEIERRWDIADLQEFSDSLLQTYGLLYLGLEGGGDLPLRHSKFVIMPDDWNTFPWGHIFYRDVVPPKQRIKIKSFHYSSPGVIEVVAILSLLGLAARVVRAWARAGVEVLALLEKVKKFLSRLSRRQEAAITQDLVFQFGLSLGFNEEDCAALIREAGTIGALKVLVGVATQGQRLAQLEQQGKLVFAEAASNRRQLPPPRGGARKRPSRRKKAAQ
jgi:hypothetical protein